MHKTILVKMLQDDKYICQQFCKYVSNQLCNYDHYQHVLPHFINKSFIESYNLLMNSLKLLNVVLLACCLISIAEVMPVNCSNSSCSSNLLDRNTIENMNYKFVKLTKISPMEYTHHENTYQMAHEVLQFIFSHLLTPTKLIDEIILTIGKTGWGKSTSINFLDGVKFKINDKQKLESVNPQDMKTKIGTGQGSTTLFPVYIETKFGKVYDLPGDEETRGMVTEIINSISKMNMGKSLSKVKILFMVPASVFSAQGSYGSEFKKYLQSSNKLLGGLNNYKDNIMIIVTFANRRKTELANILKNIQACLDHPDKALEDYKELILHLTKSKRIRLIAEPNYDQALYSVPSHAEWSDNQFSAIKQSILNLPSRDCQQSDFSVPYNLKMVDQLNSIMHILVEKVRSQFYIQSNNIKLSGIELKFAKSLLKDIRSSKHLNLKDFSAKYQTNSYFNSSQITEVVKQIQFVYQFLNAFENRQIELKKDWVSVELQKKLTKIIENIDKVCQINKLNILKTFQTSQLTVQPNSVVSSSISQNVQQLEQLYKEKHQINNNSQNQNSQYFDDFIEQVYDRTVDQIYEIDEVYLENVTQIRKYKVPKEVEFTGPVQKERVAYKTETEKYTQKVPKIRSVPKTEESTKQVQEPLPILGVFGFTQTKTLRSTSTVYVQQSYLEDEQKTRTVKVPYTEYYTEDQKQTRIQEVEEEREEQVPVQKTRKKQITRPKDLFKDQKRRKLNTTRLADAKQLNSELIEKIIIQIGQIVESGQKFELSYPIDIRVQNCKNDFEKQFIDTFKQLFALEHQALAVNRPNVRINANQQLMLAD